MSKTQSSVRSRLVRAGIATVAATVTMTAATISPAFAANVPLTLSSTTGPSGTPNPAITITASATTAWLTGVTAPVTTFSLPACPATYTNAASVAVTPTSASAGNVPTTGANDTIKISNNKATILVPPLPLAPSTAATTRYNVCVYASATANDPIIGSAAYSVAAPATLASTAVTPASGPALGGSTITVSGTGFPTTASQISATLGGAALTNITPISSTSFTAVTPYRASGTVALAVTTPAGTVTKQNAFTYSNGIVISPNTASNAQATSANPVYVDVLGSNFLAQNFGTFTAATDAANGASPNANSQVFLVDGAYNAGNTTSVYTNGPVARCTGVVIISDSELICQLNLATGKLVFTTGASAGATAPTGTVPEGTYTLTVVSNGATKTNATNDPTLSQTVTPTGITVSDISSGSTFTVAAY